MGDLYEAGYDCSWFLRLEKPKIQVLACYTAPTGFGPWTPEDVCCSDTWGDGPEKEEAESITFFRKCV